MGVKKKPTKNGYYSQHCLTTSVFIFPQSNGMG